MNRAIYAPAAQQRSVGRIHHGIDVLLSDIAFDDHDGSVRHIAPEGMLP
jgi:hypothetical protein